LNDERRRQIRSVLWAVTVLGFLAALVSAAQRWRIESRNRSVEITLDFQEVRSLAVAEGKPLRDVLTAFKKAGVVSVALSEDTVAGLEEGGNVEIVDVPASENVLIQPLNLPVSVRIQEAITKKLNRPLVRAADIGPYAFTVSLPHSAVRSLGLGLDPRLVSEIQGAGLGVVGRVANYNGVRPAGIEWTLRNLQEQKVKTVIFVGDEALGYKGYLNSDPQKPETTTDRTLRDLNLNLGTVEFGKQKGDDILARSTVDRVVRVHTILGAEMLSATIPSNVQRFQLAARERNIRLLYVRLFLDEKDVLLKNTEYIEKIVKDLERGDLEPGFAHPYDPLSTSLPLRGLIALGIAAGWLLLVDSVTRFLAGGAGILVAIAAFGGAVVLLGLPLLPMMLGVKLTAFATAIIFPTLALLHTDLLDKMRDRKGLGPVLGEYLHVSAITGLGIAMIVGLLADRLFLVKVDGFIGVKASNLLPALLVGLLYFLPLRATKIWTFGRALRETRERLTNLATKPILVWQVAVAVIAIGVLALLVLRTGNDPGVGVSGLELKIRAILDQILYTRPRFKEFLIGHPALILALLAAARGRRDLAVPLLAVAAIGQASMLGSFCHLHTPLLVSLIRALLGIIIGAIIGLMAHFLIGIAERRFSDRFHAGTARVP
jgi:hypothetical protein